MKKITPKAEVRQAYERTLKKSASCFGAATSFKCGDDDGNIDYLDCEDCPFHRSFKCNHHYSFAEWQGVWYHLTGEKDERTPEDVLNSVPIALASSEKIKDILGSQLEKIRDVVDPKFKIVYNLLGQPGEHRIESVDFPFVLAAIKLWYKDVVKWNLIAESPLSDIPNDFKDIYFRVYDLTGNLVLSDEYTLESKNLRLKLAWEKGKETLHF